MTAPEVFQVRDGDGWEVYVTNPAGGWWLLGDQGGSAVVHTLPDGAVPLAPLFVCALCLEPIRPEEKWIGHQRLGIRWHDRHGHAVTVYGEDVSGHCLEYGGPR